MGELEKLGTKYRIALRIARDERWERLACGHKGVYADDWYVYVLPILFRTKEQDSEEHGGSCGDDTAI